MRSVLPRYPKSMKVATAKGSRGRPQTSSVSIAPLSPPQRRNPCLRERQAMSGRQAIRSRPSGATQHRCWKEQLGGRSCGSAKLLAGTLRCLRLCGLFSLNWSPVELLGRCPKPHKGAPPLDPARGRRKGTKSPLDPFFAARLECFSLRFGLSGFFAFTAARASHTPPLPQLPAASKSSASAACLPASVSPDTAAHSAPSSALTASHPPSDYPNAL